MGVLGNKGVSLKVVNTNTHTCNLQVIRWE